ncbi:hypothetical protein [Sulfitobacter donghicola]|uniref:Dihydroorotate dehydrogenase n=1 Tax=Sulfitobacter donghicola DSW-25 = KCTC 12864 = JCM 14565 TaxID=1300350 RepID=A0A073IV24_9RHOB|nr:hypothetical protein [Sulfitobacter donghicola]KEJ89242.1 hypothetical protein DSW25_09430 [Sulfitobacter donghicola DSW-25 = KCTC 12864 = JCM 14565]KIN69036.1 hypothetical protein Z948_2770 [Sulfitobacter donghicola DSW-25 = KCTC 12864 = JCM 14565]
MTQPDSFDLEAAFENARANPPQMSDALSARIVADAERLQPSAPLWQRLIAAVGGPAGVGGLVTATVAGFWFGVAPPGDQVDPLVLFGAVDTVVDEDLTELMGVGWFSEEG